MSVYKQNSKVIRNASGEVLKVPPIIDISSDYGVTKDGSNLVSRVKNHYQPNVFRAPSGYEPTENGSGLEMQGGKILNNKANTPRIGTKDFEAKIKCSIIDNTALTRFFYIAKFPGSTSHSDYCLLPSLSTNKRLYFSFVPTGGVITDITLLYADTSGFAYDTEHLYSGINEIRFWRESGVLHYWDSVIGEFSPTGWAFPHDLNYNEEMSTTVGKYSTAASNLYGIHGSLYDFQFNVF